MPIYQKEFQLIRDPMDEELQVLLAFYAEDTIRTVEREVRDAEARIKEKYSGAEFIELTPMSIDADRLAIDDNLEAELRRVEQESLNRLLKSINLEERASAASEQQEQQQRQQQQQEEDARYQELRRSEGDDSTQTPK